MNNKLLQKFTSAFFSMKGMALALIVFFVGIGAATFLESIYGTQTAKIIIYNAFWFECLLLYLALNLIANTFRYKMWSREKIAMLTFHLSFIIILIGAAVTRFISFEGTMIIKEGTAVDFMYTSDPHILVYAENPKTGVSTTIAEKKYLSEITYNDFSMEGELEGKSFELEYVDFISKATDSLVINGNFKTSALEIVTEGMNSNYLGENDLIMVNGIPVSYEKPGLTSGIRLRSKGDSVELNSFMPMRYLPMTEMRKARQSGMPISDSLYTAVPANKWVTMKERTLYNFGNQQIVLKRKISHAQKRLIHTPNKNLGKDYLTVRFSYNGKSKLVRLEGGMGALPVPERFEMDGIIFQLEYGSIRKPLPFSIACRDFILDKYPGSESPSSYASELTIDDKEMKYKRDQRVFMNNVMDYRGYRFFQSSYTLDNPMTPQNEEGTKLSVNHDWWGTNITYLGYLLMSIAMLLSLFAPAGRFKLLNEKLRHLKAQKDKLSIFALTVLLSSTSLLAANHTAKNPAKFVHYEVSSEHADELASLLVQNYEGRIVPFHTLSEDILKKLYRGNTYKDLNAIQVVLGMHMYRDYWLEQKIIQVPSAVRDQLHLGEFASTIELADKEGNFKWLKQYQEAHQKPQSKQSEFDKKLIKLNEKYEVASLVFTWQYMKILPRPNDPNHNWYVPMSAELIQSDTTSSITFFKYLDAVHQGGMHKNYSKASVLLKKIKNIQRTIGKDVVPSEANVKMEIAYNKMGIFENTYKLYALLGLFTLIIYFTGIFTNGKGRSERTRSIFWKVMLGFVSIAFLYHVTGLGLRWMISGHAPWSNGYEAIVYIAWVTVLAGFIFVRKNQIVIPATLILAAMMIMVSEMNLLDPEITPLVPVLKSYWLQVHVSIITSSYAFLGLGAMLGLFNLILYIFRTKENGKLLSIQISGITYIAEMTMTIGLFLLTIGTFLGGVWANESWGRYWGWDPKETWALVSVLVYAIILHLRFIPALRSKFLFNTVAFWGYSAILFTFFGVNFMLVGLHSYAQGDGLGKFPTWLIFTIILYIILNIIAYLRYKSYSKNQLS